METSKFRLLFFGSDSFSTKVLGYLWDKQLCPVQVVTKPGTLLDKYSAANQLKRHNWPLELRNQDEFNIGLVASFGSMIDTKTINQFKFGLFNVHPSLLPRYRGSTPVQAAILNNDSDTGCTIIRIPPVAKFDIGDIILQERVPVRDGEYAFELRDRLADLGAIMSEKFLLNYEECIRNAKPQSQVGLSYARKLKQEQGLIEFKTQSSRQIELKFRAFTRFIDLFTICLNGLKVRLEGIRGAEEIKRYNLDRLASNQIGLKDVIGSLDDYDAPPPAGTIYFHKIRHILCIRCADNHWVAFNYVTPEFKSRMSGLDFYNGYLSKLDVNYPTTDT